MPLGYYGIENVGLNAAQKAQLLAALQAFGLHADPNPINNNHWRARPDGEAVLFHGNFQEAEWSVTAIKQRLAAIYGVAWTTIGHSTATPSYSPGGTTTVLTFTRTTTTYLRLAVFGGLGATQAQGQAEALGYLKANAAIWGEVS